MDEIKSIKLGGQSYEIAPPTFKQLRYIIPALTRTMPVISTPDEKAMDDMLTIILCGIQTKKPDMSRDVLMDIPMTLMEMAEAIAAIVQVSGLEPKQAGEAPAGTA